MKNCFTQAIVCCFSLALSGCGIGGSPTISAVATNCNPASSATACQITLTYNSQGASLPLATTGTVPAPFGALNTSGCIVNAVQGNQTCVISTTVQKNQSTGSVAFILGGGSSGVNAVTSNSIPLSGSGS